MKIPTPKQADNIHAAAEIVRNARVVEALHGQTNPNRQTDLSGELLDHVSTFILLHNDGCKRAAKIYSVAFDTIDFSDIAEIIVEVTESMVSHNLLYRVHATSIDFTKLLCFTAAALRRSRTQFCATPVFFEYLLFLDSTYGGNGMTLRSFGDLFYFSASLDTMILEGQTLAPFCFFRAINLSFDKCAIPMMLAARAPIDLSFYLSDFPSEDEHQFLEAVNSLAKDLDHRISYVRTPLTGSFFQDVVLSGIKWVTQSELSSRILKSLQTLVDGGAESNISKLNKIANDSDHCALRLNDMIFIKTTDRDNQVTKVAFPLNQRQIEHLKSNPMLMAAPRRLLEDFNKLENRSENK